MTAEEKVFSIPELRLYILQYAIQDHEMDRNDGCVKKCREKIEPPFEICMFYSICCVLSCLLYRPNIGVIIR